MSRRTIRAALKLMLAALLALSPIPSCAYFNTLYNARKAFREAEKATEKSGSEREQRDKYKEVVTKCSRLIQDYPKSRWIDDAEFLMGKALVKQEEYDKGIRKFQEILTNFPESGYVPQSLYWLALAYFKKQDYNQALVHADRFLKEYPKHELRYQAMFLAGDIKRALEDDEGALLLYERVAEEASKQHVTDEARRKSAELFYARSEYDKAAASYEKLLQKGIPWGQRFTISLALGSCYARMDKCREALLLFNGLLAKATSAQEIPALLLGRAASFTCMDSLAGAIKAYDEITMKYPKSIYSAEAFYRKGVIYHERLDSLKLAQEAFSKVGGEYANSEFAAPSLEKSNSMKRLIELQKSAGTGQSPEQLAGKRLMAAEIQLTRLDNIPMALAGYTAILDSFPETVAAAKAAYAIAWIRQFKLNEKETAIEQYRSLVERYPRSSQAKGALFQIGFLGAAGLKGHLRSYMDSVLADTTSLQKPAPSAHLPADTAGQVQLAAPDAAPRDTQNIMRRASPGGPPRAPRAIPPDTLGGMRTGGVSVFPDTSARAKGIVPAASDTSARAKRDGAG